ncbi:MAG: hypothetical protein RR413_03660 [Christensenellaceae bacterium]
MEVWMYDVQQAFLNLIDAELSCETAQCFCDCICISEYETVIHPMAAEHLVFIHGDQSKNYTSDEIAYLQLAPTVILFASVSDPDNLVLFIELLTDADDASITACAIMKLLNKAFHAKIVFCFMQNHTLALGCMQYGDTLANHFFISQWHSAELGQAIQEILDNCNGRHLELMDEIVASSVLERWNNPFDIYTYDTAHILALQEFMSFYSVDLNFAIEQYENGFFCPPKNEYGYKDISNILKEIGELEMTSYEFLEKANKAKEISDSRAIIEDSIISLDNSETLRKVQLISTDALNNPVKLLEII